MSGPRRERLRRLLAVRVAGRQLALLVAFSLTSTGLVIAGALTGNQPPAALAALLERSGIVVHRRPAPAASVDVASDPAPASAPTTLPPKAKSTSTGNTSANSGGDDPAPAADGGDTTTTPTTTTPAAPPAGTKIKHVFVIALTSRGYDASFGASAASSYLVGTLVPKGALLSQYRTLDAADLPNALALVSGQPPNPDTQQECPSYADFPAGTKPATDGSVGGSGCVYPVTTLTLADQLSSAGRRWRAYVQGMPAGKTCSHPAAGTTDATLTGTPPTVASAYATRHNPFVYFHSLLDLGDCASNDAGLDALANDLKTTAATPNLAWIVPDLCHDGASDACAVGQPGGAAAADAFLAQWVPQILASPAYQADGLLIVTFDGVRASLPAAPPPVRSAPPATTTTITPAGVPTTTTTTTTTAAGTTTTTTTAAGMARARASAADATPDPRRVGTLLLSRWTKPGTIDTTSADPDALLRTVEDLFGLAHLARAGAAGTPSLAPVALGEGSSKGGGQ